MAQLEPIALRMPLSENIRASGLDFRGCKAFGLYFQSTPPPCKSGIVEYKRTRRKSLLSLLIATITGCEVHLAYNEGLLSDFGH